MPEEKSIIFISHIVEENELALQLKDLVNQSFLGLIDVFISSDEASISMGRRWLETITQALKACAVEIVICSPKSVERPWINFEAGAGWIRDVPVVPLCHSGMKRDALPVPLNMLQAANAGDTLDLERIFAVFAEAIGATKPKVDFTDFIGHVTAFEEKYTFWDMCNTSFAQLNKLSSEIILALKATQEQSGVGVEIDLSDIQAEVLRPYLDFLEEKNILRARPSGNVKIGNMGAAAVLTGYIFQPLDNFESVYVDSRFNFSGT